MPCQTGSKNKTLITVAISSIVAMTAIVGILQTSINSIHHRFDDMNQRLSDMNHRLNDVRAEMNQRFDDQDKYINQRFDAVDQRFGGVDQRFDAVDQRFDIQDRRIEDLAKDISELRKLSDRVSRNEGELDVIRQQLKLPKRNRPLNQGQEHPRQTGPDTNNSGHE